MRRIFLTIVAALAMSSNMFAQKYVMQVNMKDGSVLEYSVEDIDSVTFREVSEGDNDKIDERALINDYIQKNNVTVISKEQSGLFRMLTVCHGVILSSCCAIPVSVAALALQTHRTHRDCGS